MRSLLAFALSLLTGCSFLGGLDRLGNNEPAWDFRLTWDRFPAPGPENPSTPGFDADGNRIPAPETQALFSFPPITAGLSVEAYPHVRVTPTVGVAVIDFKVPYARWMDVQLFGGSQELGVGIYKRWTSIIELTTGAGLIWDFEAKKPGAVLGFTITKF